MSSTQDKSSKFTGRTNSLDEEADSPHTDNQGASITSGQSAAGDFVCSGSLRAPFGDLADGTTAAPFSSFQDDFQDLQVYQSLGTCFNDKQQQATSLDTGNPVQQNGVMNNGYGEMSTLAGREVKEEQGERQSVAFSVGESVRTEVQSRGDASRSPSPMLERAGFKKPREREGWYYSRPHETYPASANWGPDAVEMGRGRQSGRNHLAKFGDDPTPRLKWPLMIRNAKDEQNNPAVRAYPNPTLVPVPARTSLKEMCEKYPRHAWGTGLRVFGCEQWGAKDIWQLLPRDYRLESAAQRPWNYLQAAMGRELDKVAAEEGRPRIKKQDGKRRRTPGSGGSDSFSDQTPEAARKRQRADDDSSPLDTQTGPEPTGKRQWADDDPSALRARAGPMQTRQPVMSLVERTRAQQSAAARRPSAAAGTYVAAPVPRTQAPGMLGTATATYSMAPMAAWGGAPGIALHPTIHDLIEWSHDEQGRSLGSFAMRLLAERVEYQMASDRTRGAMMAEFWRRQLTEYGNEMRRQHQQEESQELIADLPALARSMEEMVRRLRPQDSEEQCWYEAWKLVWLKFREKHGSLGL
ncbi:hypothetical protein DV737_g2618, partial [Chaetothyriales sp. CBS 132003]